MTSDVQRENPLLVGAETMQGCINTHPEWNQMLTRTPRELLSCVGSKVPRCCGCKARPLVSVKVHQPEPDKAALECLRPSGSLSEGNDEHGAAIQLGRRPDQLPRLRGLRVDRGSSELAVHEWWSDAE